jgi:hypothetical protein
MTPDGILIFVKPFTYKFGQDAWPEGLTLLHAYVLPDLPRNPGLAALVSACREATRGEPLAHVPDEWLHITLCQIAVPSDQVSAADRAALAAEIGKRVAGFPPFTITAGNPFCVATGVLIDVTAGAIRLDLMRAEVAAAVQTALGAATPLTGVDLPLHLTASYAYGEADDDRVRARLDGLAVREAPLPVEAVALVDVSVNQATKGITWTPVARFPLG